MTIEQERLTPTQEGCVTVADYNALFDPANDAGQETFTAGFREGFIYALAPDGSEYSEVAADFDSSVDGVVLGEAWQAHRDQFFAHLPLAALPEIGAALKSPPIGGEGEKLSGVFSDGRYACVGCGELWEACYLENDRCPDCVEHGDIIQPQEPTPTTSGDVGKLCERTATTMKGDGNDVSRTHPLIDRLAEVVRHSPECAGFGRGDEHCDCDAVAALEEAATLLTQMEARTAALEKALGRIEAACDTIAGLRTQEMYLAMIDAGQGDALSELGDARQAARALLNPTPTEER